MPTLTRLAGGSAAQVEDSFIAVGPEDAIPAVGDVILSLARFQADGEALLAAGRTPSARYEPRRYDACSLLELCRPKALEKPRRVAAWLDRLVEEEM